MRATGTLVLVLAWLFAMPLTAEVYKVVDEDGNITYTDRPPDPEAAPLDLPALNEVGKREASPEEEAAAMPVEAVELPDDPSIHKLRREYRDFRIIHPVDGFTFRGGSNPATVAWGTVSVPFFESLENEDSTKNAAISAERTAGTGDEEIVKEKPPAAANEPLA